MTLLKAEKKPVPKQTRIMVFGTFEIVHAGHRHLFVQARKLAKNPFLIVSLARDKNVLKIKGRLPKNNQSKRLAVVAADSLVNKAVLGGAGDHIPHIVKEKPDIIALGYDQTAYVRGLRTALRSAGLKTRVVRLKPHKPHLYKTSILTAKKIGKKTKP